MVEHVSTVDLSRSLNVVHICDVGELVERKTNQLFNLIFRQSHQSFQVGFYQMPLIILYIEFLFLTDINVYSPFPFNRGIKITIQRYYPDDFEGARLSVRGSLV